MKKDKLAFSFGFSLVLTTTKKEPMRSGFEIPRGSQYYYENNEKCVNIYILLTNVCVSAFFCIQKKNEIVWYIRGEIYLYSRDSIVYGNRKISYPNHVCYE